MLHLLKQAWLVRVAAFAGSLAVFACGGTAVELISVRQDLETPRAGSDSPMFMPVRAEAGGFSDFPVFTDAGSPPELRVLEAVAPGGEPRRFPLQQTKVRAELAGFAADVEVEQVFRNSEKTTIEALYVFPLPENAAVYRMEVKVGDRTIVGKVDERAAAKATYDRAKKAGFVAALTEQDRSNVFRQSIANLEPGKQIRVSLRYTQRLHYDSGVHEFVFPMVVGPRYTPGSSDAARLQLATLPNDQRSGHDVRLEVLIPSDLLASEIKSVAHAVSVEKQPSGLLRVVLDPAEKIANRDFILRYRVATDTPRATMLVGPTGSGPFALTIDPPNLNVSELVGARELVFVVDVSGSMSGVPLALCKDALRAALSMVGPRDTFNVISFAGRTEKLFPTAQKASDAAIRRAADFVDTMRAGGGTEMLDAVAEALRPTTVDGRHRYVFFMTDGFVSVEDQILRSTRTFVSQIEAQGKRAKVFAFGVGSSPNRSLLETLSREGKGATVYATNREDPVTAVNRFFRYLDASVLRNAQVDFGSAPVASLTPSRLPDVFASRPLVVFGRLDRPADGAITVRADGASGPISLPVRVIKVPYRDAEQKLGMLWARARVEALEADFAFGNRTVEREIVALGKEFGILTRFTSFVAVDSHGPVQMPLTTTVVQPVEAPEGVITSAPPPEHESLRAAARVDSAPMSPSPMETRGMRGCSCRIGARPSELPWPLGGLLLLLMTARRLVRNRRSRS